MVARKRYLQSIFRLCRRTHGHRLQRLGRQRRLRQVRYQIIVSRSLSYRNHSSIPGLTLCRLKSLPEWRCHRQCSLQQRYQIYLWPRLNVALHLNCADVEYVAAFKNLQETLRRRDSEIYGLQSKVIELESQLERYRRAEGRENDDNRGKGYRR